MALKPVGRSRSNATAAGTAFAEKQTVGARDALFSAAADRTRREETDPPGPRARAGVPSAASERDDQTPAPGCQPASPRAPRGELPAGRRSGEKRTRTPAIALRSCARSLESHAESNCRQAEVALVACDLAAKNVKAGMETSRRLSASLGEISRQISRLPGRSATAREQIADSRAEFAEMAAAGDRMERLVKGMSALARQVGSLSFNATMEAARPGNGAGGFSIIATELQTVSRRLLRTGKLVRRELDVVRRSSAGMDAAMQSAADSLKATEERAAELDRRFAEQCALAEAVARELADTVNALTEAGRASNGLSRSAGEYGARLRQLQELVAELSQDAAA